MCLERAQFGFGFWRPLGVCLERAQFIFGFLCHFGGFIDAIYVLVGLKGMFGVFYWFCARSGPSKRASEGFYKMRWYPQVLYY